VERQREQPPATPVIPANGHARRRQMAARRRESNWLGGRRL